MKNKPLDINNDLIRNIGECGYGISVSDFSINGDGEIIFVSAWKSDKEVKAVSWGSGNVRVGWL